MMSVVNRKEKVQIERQRGKAVVRRQVVEDVGRERQAILARVVQVLWLGVTALEALLGARVLLKLAAADPSVPFAVFVYRASAWFLVPFRGLTAAPSANGVVFEVSTIIAMAAYVLAGWLVVRLIWLVFRPASHRSVKTYEEIS
jgi:hypothetical protein